MAKGTFIKGNRVEMLISNVYLNHPHWKAKQVREEVIKRLHDPEDTFYDRYCEPNWPSLNAIRDRMKEQEKELNKRPSETKGMDEPWSILSLSNYDISADALPIIFELWAYALKEYRKPLTIREVKWAARLYKIIHDDLEGLLLSSIRYAAYQKSSEALGDKITLIAREVGFMTDTELYVDTHRPELTPEEFSKVMEDPEISKRKRHYLLDELRSPEILKLLGLENKTDQTKRK